MNIFTILYDVICYASRRLLPWFIDLLLEYSADLKCENAVVKCYTWAFSLFHVLFCHLFISAILFCSAAYNKAVFSHMCVSVHNTAH